MEIKETSILDIPINITVEHILIYFDFYELKKIRSVSYYFLLTSSKHWKPWIKDKFLAQFINCYTKFLQNNKNWPTRIYGIDLHLDDNNYLQDYAILLPHLQTVSLYN